MRRKVAKACFGITVLGLFSALTVVNLGAYTCLKKMGLREWTKKIKNYGSSGIQC